MKFLKTTAKEQTITDDGKTVDQVYTYIKECEFYADAEYATKALHPNADVDVYPMKSLKEIFNPEDATKYDTTKIGILTATYIIKGKEKKKRYKILVFCKDLDDAKHIIEEHLKQGYDNMELTSIKDCQIQGLLK